MADPTTKKAHALSKENMLDYISFLDSAQKDTETLVGAFVSLAKHYAPPAVLIEFVRMAEVGVLLKKQMAHLRADADFEVLVMPEDPE